MTTRVRPGPARRLGAAVAVPLVVEQMATTLSTRGAAGVVVLEPGAVVVRLGPDVRALAADGTPLDAAALLERFPEIAAALADPDR